MQGCSH